MLTVSQHALPGGPARGVPAQGVPAQGGVPAREGRVYLRVGGVPAQVLPPVNRMTDRCKNITLPQTSFEAVKILYFKQRMFKTS